MIKIIDVHKLLTKITGKFIEPERILENIARIMDCFILSEIYNPEDITETPFQKIADGGIDSCRFTPIDNNNYTVANFIDGLYHREVLYLRAPKFTARRDGTIRSVIIASVAHDVVLQASWMSHEVNVKKGESVEFDSWEISNEGILPIVQTSPKQCKSLF